MELIVSFRDGSGNTDSHQLAELAAQDLRYYLANILNVHEPRIEADSGDINGERLTKNQRAVAHAFLWGWWSRVGQRNYPSLRRTHAADASIVGG